jgi:ABC-type phosphate transport system auxiliary subunit
MVEAVAVALLERRHLTGSDFTAVIETTLQRRQAGQTHEEKPHG